MMMVLEKFLLAIFSGMCLGKELNLPTPDYQWPLENKFLLYETVNKSHFSKEPDDECYRFKEVFSKISNEALSFGSTEHDVHYLHTELRYYKDKNLLESDKPQGFKNLSISMYVYPTETPKGTLLHYVLGPEEKIRITFISGLAVLSFRDQYGNAAGLVAEKDLLKVNQWNHLYVERQFENGRIKIFLDGELKRDVNNDFQKYLPMPKGGELFIGNTILKDASAGDQQFHGYITCLQIYTQLINEVEINNLWKNCKQPRMKFKPPEFYLIPRGSVQCVSKVPPPLPPVAKNLVTRSVLCNENQWNTFRRRFNWKTSTRTTGYFKMKSRDSKPLIVPTGSVNATDTSVCTRLCMRIDGCQSFVINQKKEFVTCHMYDSVNSELRLDGGSKFYMAAGYG